MKHPLTSKERRGLAAVAAAALLCISSGFVFRSCSSHSKDIDSGKKALQVPVYPQSGENIAIPADSSSVASKQQKKSSNGKRSRRAKRRASDRAYPERDPLSQPCD